MVFGIFDLRNESRERKGIERAKKHLKRKRFSPPMRRLSRDGSPATASELQPTAVFSPEKKEAKLRVERRIRRRERKTKGK